jgi:hypothetical protein
MLKLFKCYLITLLFFCNSFPKNKPILILSIPKCGTHMVIKCVELLTKNKNIKEFSWVPKNGSDERYINKLVKQN